MKAYIVYRRLTCGSSHHNVPDQMGKIHNMAIFCASIVPIPRRSEADVEEKCTLNYINITDIYLWGAGRSCTVSVLMPGGGCHLGFAHIENMPIGFQLANRKLVKYDYN